MNNKTKLGLSIGVTALSFYSVYYIMNHYRNSDKKIYGAIAVGSLMALGYNSIAYGFETYNKIKKDNLEDKIK